MAECLKIRIDVPFALLIFAFMFADSVTTNWVMFRTCYVIMGFNKSDCALLGSKHQNNFTTHLEEKVQPHVTIINMTKMLIEAFSTVIVCFFLGPWSDKYGRKPVFLLNFGGYTIAYLILAVISAIPGLSPWFILLYVVPLCFSGGFMTLIAAVLCYITDLTLPEKRGVRIAIFYGVTTVGALLGTLSSSYALQLFGYFVTYLIAASCIFLSWLMVFLFLPESVANPETENKFRNLFKLSLVRETIKTTFKRRDNYDRVLLLTVILLLVVYLVATTDSMMFLYLREKFQWSLQKYTVYNCLNIVTAVIGSILGTYCLNSLLGIKESTVIMVGFLSLLSGALLGGLATNSWLIYAGAVSSCLGATVSPLSRALVSKVVPAEEYGKIFSFIAICESIITPLGSLLYTYIYNKTLSTFPGAFLIVSAGIYVFGLVFSIAAITMQKNQAEMQYSIFNDQVVET